MIVLGNFDTHIMIKKIRINECCERLNLTKQAIFSRIKKGFLDAEKDEKGFWWVYDNDKITGKYERVAGKNKILPEKKALEPHGAELMPSSYQIKFNQMTQVVQEVASENKQLANEVKNITLEVKKVLKLGLFVSIGLVLFLIVLYESRLYFSLKNHMSDRLEEQRKRDILDSPAGTFTK